jgi:hypothetical protein
MRKNKRRKIQDLKLATKELMKIFYAESTHICSERGEAVALARSVLKYFLKSYPSYPIRIKAT